MRLIRSRVSPMAARRARELGVPLDQVHGTGARGVVVAADVERVAAGNVGFDPTLDDAARRRTEVLFRTVALAPLGESAPATGERLDAPDASSRVLHRARAAVEAHARTGGADVAVRATPDAADRLLPALAPGSAGVLAVGRVVVRPWVAGAAMIAADVVDLVLVHDPLRLDTEAASLLLGVVADALHSRTDDTDGDSDDDVPPSLALAPEHGPPVRRKL